MAFCGRCGTDLPEEKVETEKKPIGPLYAPRSAPDKEPAPAALRETDFSITRVGALLLGILLFSGATAAFYLHFFDDSTERSYTAQPQRVVSDAAETHRYRIVRLTAALIHDQMREPESLQFVQLKSNHDATVVCADYRARNGFGGMAREILVVTAHESSQDAHAWAQHCQQGMHDMRWAWP